MRKFLAMIECCFNWRVAAGLGALAVGIGLWEPRLFLPALSTVVVLICPLSMVGMAVMMTRNGQKTPSPVATADRVTAIQQRLTDLQQQQAAIAHAMAELATPDVVAEAEAVAQAAARQTFAKE